MKSLLPLLALLAGCSSYPMPPPTPSPTDIQIASATVNAINMPPADYYVYGTSLAAKNCVGWFGSQIAAQSQNSALSGELGLLGTAAGAAGGPAGAAVAAAMGFGVSSLANAQHNAVAGIDPVATYGLTRKVQQAWLAAAPTPQTPSEAYMLVEDFAEKCQLPEIRQAIVAAVSTAPVRAVPMSGAATFGFAPEPRRRVMPPTVIIGEPVQVAEPQRRAEVEQPAHIRRRVPRSAPVGSIEWFRQTSKYVAALDGPR